MVRWYITKQSKDMPGQPSILNHLIAIQSQLESASLIFCTSWLHLSSIAFIHFIKNWAGTHYSISLGSQDLQCTQVSGSRDINSSDTDLRACMTNSRPTEGLLPRRYSRDNAVFLLTHICQFLYKSSFGKCVCCIIQKNAFPAYWDIGPPQTFISSFDITRDKISNSVRTATLSIHLHLICMILVRSIWSQVVIMCIPVILCYGLDGFKSRQTINFFSFMLKQKFKTVVSLMDSLLKVLFINIVFPIQIIFQFWTSLPACK